MAVQPTPDGLAEGRHHHSDPGVARLPGSGRIGHLAITGVRQFRRMENRFADGVIAYGGRALGSEQLATFDREAARLLSAAGDPVLLL
jgi:hypothetical protein